VTTCPISVLIPTFNRPSGLAEALQSLANQTLVPEEIIVINDAGVSVQNVIDAYADLPINYVENSENQGHLAIRNQAIAMATQDWVMSLDDDDYLLPTHIESVWTSRVDAAFVYTDAEIVHFRLEGEQRIPTGRRLFAYEWDPDLLRKFNTIVPSGSLYLKELHDTLGAFDSAVHNYWDWDWCLRVASTHRIVRVPQASVIYAFADAGDNQSAQLSPKRGSYFQAFCTKHNLGELPMMNFAMMLDEPLLKLYETTSTLLWDGQPLRSRLVFHS
jgi:glycosyltransferase involved in cell wall biosynthesis